MKQALFTFVIAAFALGCKKEDDVPFEDHVFKPLPPLEEIEPHPVVGKWNIDSATYISMAWNAWWADTTFGKAYNAGSMDFGPNFKLHMYVDGTLFQPDPTSEGTWIYDWGNVDDQITISDSGDVDIPMNIIFTRTFTWLEKYTRAVYSVEQEMSATAGAEYSYHYYLTKNQ